VSKHHDAVTVRHHPPDDFGKDDRLARAGRGDEEKLAPPL
jgi:hypothetical protein